MRTSLIRVWLLTTIVLTYSVIFPHHGRAFDFYDLYLVAHADDWQIFQAPNTFNDVKLGDRVLIVHASASDAGRTDGYWQAREEGAKASVRWMVGSAPETQAWITVCSQVLCHNIFTWTYGPVSVAFLRVPDGGGEGADQCGSFGSGTPAYNCNSLSRLRDTGRALPAVDQSTTYASWPDFYGTVLGLADYFRLPRTQMTWLNAPEFDRTLNPGDHPDHLAVGDVARELQLHVGTWHAAYFVGNHIAQRPVNLTQEFHDIKMGLYYSYYTRLVDLVGNTSTEICESEAGYAATLWRTYFRTF
jgi:hypothetical protein